MRSRRGNRQPPPSAPSPRSVVPNAVQDPSKSECRKQDRPGAQGGCGGSASSSPVPEIAGGRPKRCFQSTKSDTVRTCGLPGADAGRVRTAPSPPPSRAAVKSDRTPSLRHAALKHGIEMNLASLRAGLAQLPSIRCRPRTASSCWPTSTTLKPAAAAEKIALGRRGLGRGGRASRRSSRRSGKSAPQSGVPRGAPGSLAKNPAAPTRTAAAALGGDRPIPAADDRPARHAERRLPVPVKGPRRQGRRDPPG